MTIEHALAAGIVALSGAVSVLWVRTENERRRTEKRLTNCERDRAQLWAHFLNYTKKASGE